ncbi:tetrathionate reductase alpha subunit domain protein, partial [Vibrio parahaemolyticus V-223/04]
IKAANLVCIPRQEKRHCLSIKRFRLHQAKYE